MQPGDVIRPTSGRDEGRPMFVLSHDAEGNLLLADGKLRRVERPKKKKPKHAQWVASPEGRVSEKLRAGEKVTNNELRRALAFLHSPGDATG